MSDKESRILDATGHLLAQQGFHGLSMQQVAREAGVAAGTIYRYFDSKTDLILALHARLVARISQALLEGYPREASLYDRYRHWWWQCWRVHLGQPDLILCKYQFDRLPGEDNQSRMWQLEEEYFADWLAFLEEGRQSGLFKDLPDEVLSALSIEVCLTLSHKQSTGHCQFSQQQLQAAMEASWQALCQSQGVTP
ncbi:TetR/AcrR family transcriptional regulator [Gallaecimonas sp. GXIMD4217]|uniref:TetR/AcrR family transcriptional regulator n=1 Tax=Gallaecimonas sp. GXIMD4217 TaxID=3131927 RepID=UPI00311B1502